MAARGLLLGVLLHLLFRVQARSAHRRRVPARSPHGRTHRGHQAQIRGGQTAAQLLFFPVIAWQWDHGNRNGTDAMTIQTAKSVAAVSSESLWGSSHDIDHKHNVGPR
uniref:Putative secreted protein n=1 Tax=Ixodes scapularis TaxID=6945 RepID=A0A4D5RXQ0_IXOSC